MNKDIQYQPVDETPYEYDRRLDEQLKDLRVKVNTMRTLIGSLSGESLDRLNEYFRLKQIYNSNAIEGNTLTMGETRMVIEQGLTLTGKPLKYSVEARNLADALDFFEELVKRNEGISLRDIKQLHQLVLKGIDDRNAGRFRSIQVEISGSMYSPPDPARVDTEMNQFGKWLEGISHGYPLVILTKDDRHRYYDALEETQGSDISAFIRLVLESALESFEIYEQIAQAQLENQQYLYRLLNQEDQKIRGEYEIFESAISLLKGYLKQLAQEFSDLSAQKGSYKRIGFKEFDGLEYEKYQELYIRRSTKRTWYLRFSLYRIGDLRSENTTRYLFFFGFPSTEMRREDGISKVTLHIALETYPSHYERLSEISDASLPNLLEVGYISKEEKFAYLDREKQVHKLRAEAFARHFIQQTLDHFE